MPAFWEVADFLFPVLDFCQVWIIFCLFPARVAQWIEQKFPKLLVGGSIPLPGTSYFSSPGEKKSNQKKSRVPFPSVVGKRDFFLSPVRRKVTKRRAVYPFPPLSGKGIFFFFFCALRFGNSGAHSPHIAKCHKSYRAYKSYKSYRAYSGIARTLCIAPSAFPANSPPFCARLRCATPWQALRFCISGAHSPHIALCRLPSEASGEGGSVQVRTSPYKSVFPCPHPVPCAMCPASQRECAMFFGERTAHGARGETSLFPPCAPLSPRVLYRGLRHAMRLL